MGTATSYTSDAIDAKLSQKVGLTGDELVTGVKTFGSSPILPPTTPLLDDQAVSKKYVDDSVNIAQGFVVVNSVEDIPLGAPPDLVYLVVNAPAAYAVPEIVMYEYANITGGPSSGYISMGFPPPMLIQDGDLILVFLAAQHNTATWSVSAASSGFELVMAPAANVDRRTSAVYAYYYDEGVGSVPPVCAFELSEGEQRMTALMVLIRGAATEEAVSVGSMEAANGIGDYNTTAASVLNPAPKGLHLAWGYANGNVSTNGDSAAAPTVTGDMELVRSQSEPTTPSAGFTAQHLFQRDLESSGASGPITFDWPQVSQRATVSLVVACKED